ncbi:MAG: hypothetical protein EXR57_00255 [Dehalococcoidia bacterium]|nr:hypothetical protein [Dehalococcoidia bacterium]MSQ34236.1 hypothetical protein [Dehalococcoidia bacterium]
MFSWNSPSAGGLRDRRGEISDEELIQLMAEQPRLIRRPILVRDGTLIFGYKDGQYCP